jgi:sulfur-oxidizing protein SoxX
MRIISIGSVVVAALSLGCGEGRKAASGFHLPDGDPVKGKAVFADQKCHSCHRVDGVDFPAPVADPPLAVRLGGQVYQVKTDGELASAILDPSHRISVYPPEGMTSGKLSRMGDFSESVTGRDVIDLVAFLQSRYERVRPPER